MACFEINKSLSIIVERIPNLFKSKDKVKPTGPAPMIKTDEAEEDEGESDAVENLFNNYPSTIYICFK